MIRKVVRRRLFVGVLLFVVAVPTLAQEQALSTNGFDGVRFQKVDDIEQHLPQSSVYSILEDQAGFLWFATREGVVRWDGYEMESWRHDPLNESTIPGNIVRQMIQDRTGDIWVLTQNYLQVDVGIARIKAPAFNSVTRFEDLSGRLFLNSDSTISVASSDSIYSFSATTGRFHGLIERYNTESKVGDVVPIDEQTIWLVDEPGSIERCSYESSSCDPVQTVPSIAAMAYVVPSAGMHLVESTGEVLLVHPGSLALINTSDASVSMVADFLAESSSTFVADIEEDEFANVWILTSDGIYVTDSIQNFQRAHHIPLLTSAGEPNLAPIDLHIDRSGTVWVGTVWGLYRYSPYEKRFSHWQHNADDTNSLSSGLVVSLAEDSSGGMWVGTIGGGLNKVDLDHGTVTRFRKSDSENSLSNDVVWALSVSSDGTVWAGTSWGLNRYLPETNTFRSYYVDPGKTDPSHIGQVSANSIAGMATDTVGDIWFSDSMVRSVTRFQTQQERFVSTLLNDSLDVGYVSIDSENTLWFGASHGIFTKALPDGPVELFGRAPGNGDFDGILSFYRPEGGGLWVGTNSGLYLLSNDGQIESRISIDQGLPSSTVYSVIGDDAGRLWVSTNRGLASIEFTDEADSIRVRAFDLTNGIRNTEFNRQAYLKTSSGHLLFGGDLGVTYFHPSDVSINTYIPPIAITSIGRATRQGGSAMRYIADSRPVRIKPDEVTFSIEFAALSYINSERNEYAVKLQGWDRDWLDLGRQRSISYSNLPPGQYLFQVRGSNEDGVWNMEGAEIEIIVEPAFWQTLWFLLLTMLTIAGVIIGITAVLIRVRYNRQLNQLRAEQVLEGERSRISRDMHDEVGANITEIAILSELALRQSGDGSETQSFLGRIADKSRDILDSVGEIIWAINPQNDSGQRFIPYLREYASAYCEAMRLKATLEFPLPNESIRATAEVRRNVFLILKESLTNIAKHAEASNVSISAVLTSSELVMQIKDDGRGFNGEESSGNGLTNMRARAAELGGVLNVKSVAERGTSITLTVDLSKQSSIQLYSQGEG
ncbi:MAG: hypothetical protein HKN43_06060 [Rhodothermales bacterium]|nr:hypothetical protein [Rhodothermales bacterium]